MICRHCKKEVRYEAGYLEDEDTGSKRCSVNKILTHQKFPLHEPKAQPASQVQSIARQEIK